MAGFGTAVLFGGQGDILRMAEQKNAKNLGLGDITAELTFSRGALSFGF